VFKSFKNIAVTLVYTIVCGEVAVRGLALFMPIYDIEMIRYATELKLASPHPVLSHEHIPNASARLMGVSVELNELGHRDPPANNQAEGEETRIYVAGSSISLGWGVAVQDTFSAKLQRRLNEQNTTSPGRRYTVMNAGVGNYNTVYQVERFQQQVDAVKPELAILQYFVNDAEPNPGGTDNPLFRYSYFAALIYVKLRVAIFSLFTSESLGDYYAALYEENQPGWQAVKTAIRKMQVICDERGIDMLVLLVPDLHNLDQKGPYPVIYDKLMANFAALGVSAVNAYPKVAERFSEDPQKAWVSNDDAHPNAETHAIYAEVLANHLTRAGKDQGR